MGFDQSPQLIDGFKAAGIAIDRRLPVLPVWLTAHHELRASRRLRLVFDFLAQALVGWGESAP